MKTNAAWLRANLTTPLPALLDDANEKLHLVSIMAIEDLINGSPRTRTLRKRPALGVPAGSPPVQQAPGAKRGIDRSARALAGQEVTA